MSTSSQPLKLTIFMFAICSITIEPSIAFSHRRSDFTERCPLVKPMRNFQIDKMMGFWHIVEYYTSTEETPEYRCMQSELSITSQREITMNFTYAYIYDSDNDFLNGNITWAILNLDNLSNSASSLDLSHWVHSEDFYEGIYNTYVIDTDYENWSLMMNCAEKKKNPRYLSAMVMSRKRSLGHNVKVYLREKLQKYNIDLNFMFAVDQDECNLSPSINMKYYYDHMLKPRFDAAQ